MNKDNKIYVAGHMGLIGSAILRRLLKDGYTNIVTKSHTELDFMDQVQVRSFFEKEKIDYVFFAAAKVGGVYANNTYRAEFIYENIMMQSNVLHHSFLSEVKKVIFFACADIYPKNCPQPAKEEYLLTGKLEPTCEPFAIAKIAGLKMCESYNRQYGTDFITVIPPNIYGPNQHYDAMNSQVLPALIKRFHEAKISNSGELVIWGTGSPVRDFLFVDDVADTCLFLINEYSGNDIFNIGTGKGFTIKELAEIIKKEVSYRGKIIFDKTKHEGVAKKLLDTSRINDLGWRYKTELVDGVKISYNSFLSETEKKEVRVSNISRIQTCEKDINFIDKLKLSNSVSENVQPNTYKDKVVIKPWGYEFLAFDNGLMAIWFLYIKNGHSTSIHCHPQKKTSLVLLQGEAMCSTFLKRRYLKGGDALILEKSVFHSTKSLSKKEGLALLEMETPPIKTDLIRLEDHYGREMSGYEGILEMETHNLQKYNYFYFEELDRYGKYTYKTDTFSVTFEVFLNNDEFQKIFKAKSEELYTLCRGKILDRDGNVLLDLGNTQKGEILSGSSGLNISGKTVLLKIKSNLS